MIYKELLDYLKDKGVQSEYEAIDKFSYQVAFKINRQMNIYIYENSFIKIYMNIGMKDKNVNDEELLQKINDYNSTHIEETITIIDNQVYATASILFLSDIKGKNIYDTAEKLDSIYSDIRGYIGEDMIL